MKKQINLYQPSCYPKREKATFKQFLALIGFCLLSAGAVIMLLNNQLTTTQQATREHKALLGNKLDELQTLTKKLKNNQAPDSKLRLHKNLQAEIAAKQRFLASLSGIELAKPVSFSTLMRGLSLAYRDTISINEFSIIDGRLNISGEAKYSDSVALWLTKVQETQELSGISFEKLNMSEIENSNHFSFSLSNSIKKKADSEKGEAVKVDKHE